MIARVGFFENFAFEDREYVLETVSGMPGFMGAYHLVDRSTGEALSVSFWTSEGEAEAAQFAVGEASRTGEHEGPGPSRVQVFEVVEHLPEPTIGLPEN
jgi:hypothetical protein